MSDSEAIKRQSVRAVPNADDHESEKYGLTLQRSWSSDEAGKYYHAVPDQSSAFATYFKDYFTNEGPDGATIWQQDPKKAFPAFELNERNKRIVKTWDSQYADDPNHQLEREILSPPYWFNQTDLESYYKHIQKTPETFYKGMFEAIGRTTIYAAQFMDNPFAKFMKDPVTQGNAVMSGYLEDTYSRHWNFRGAQTEAGDYLTGKPIEKEPRYTATTPSLKTSVARMQFVREIAIRMDPQFYQQHCQTPEMVGDFAAALSAQSHARYMNDMYEACKMYFCGTIRVEAEPTDSVVDMGPGMQLNPPAEDVRPDAVNNKKSQMVACVRRKDTEEDKCLQDRFNKALNDTIDVDFNFLSTKFNPHHRNTRSENITLIMDKHYNYDMFKSKYSNTYHEEYIKPKVTPIWIDEFPKLATNPFNPNYELAAMLVDDNALAIYPQGEGLTVHTEFNGQQESVNVFTHYKYIFEFKPFFNRKYIYVQKAGFGNDDD